MTPILYFLRSSESKIVQNMTKHAHKDAPNLNIYYDFYGLTPKDMGLYALLDSTIVGAIWTRELKSKTPRLSLAILPQHRGEGVAKAMMEQFFLEAGAVYESLEVDTYGAAELISFYEKFGFTSSVDTLMIKKLEKKELTRPSDGYDPRKWMD
ncbi:GNAT family N-acetyltransferase [Sulfurimonas sp. SAG-AH-194-L11]|nr:GNAT family N-acetyltransferase [Sulfurimonas sp. SAG-AH-194-L11]MDF1877730.1 GNAT family N-acetyltransferase [Sulfurimonas sp. SAG-AH-194-L11]